LVRTTDRVATIWNASDCTFSVLSHNAGILVVARDQRNFHLSSASVSFMELPVKPGRLPAEAIAPSGAIKPRSIRIISAKHSDGLPADASQFDADHPRGYR
jgi:hypothetical protein